MTLKRLVRRASNLLGLDIVHYRESPSSTLLGIRHWPISSVIDVGANEGQFARGIVDVFPQAKLFCFEPLAGPFANLKRWAATEEGRVTCFNQAVGDHTGEIEMQVHSDHSPSSSILSTTHTCHVNYLQTRAQRTTRVRISTLDAALRELLPVMQDDILLKIDVQGFEDHVLRGAASVLSRCRACIIEINIAPLYDGQGEFLTLARRLDDAGLRFVGNITQVYGHDGQVLYFDSLFTRR